VSPDPRQDTSQDAGQDGASGRDWTDAAIEWASGTTAVAMFAYGVALSYSVLYRIASAAGLPAWAADLWPLGFEAFMASAALNALAEQRTRTREGDWWRRVPWYPWALTGATAGGSILLNWFHPAIPLDPPPRWLVSLVYGLPPLAAVFAWHLFLQRLAHRRHQDHQQAKQDTTQPERSGELATPPADPLGTVRELLARETPAARVTARHVQEVTGLSRSRAYAVLRQLRPGHPRQQRPAATAGPRPGAGAMRLRLHGTPAEVERAIERLTNTFEVVAISATYAAGRPANSCASTWRSACRRARHP
jgi:Protein of unknown function (DUF2637)